MTTRCDVMFLKKCPVMEFLIIWQPKSTWSTGNGWKYSKPSEMEKHRNSLDWRACESPKRWIIGPVNGSFGANLRQVSAIVGKCFDEIANKAVGSSSSALEIERISAERLTARDEPSFQSGFLDTMSVTTFENPLIH
ncbi:hypothetical protein DVH05_026366 [Phytophthora capsici]|nr:hypothetical protein DVH05_026366 [Phytophthora capsici]